MTAKIESVQIKWEYDEYPDVSWLDCTAEDHYGKEGSNWDYVPKEVEARVIEEYGSLWEASKAYAWANQRRLKDFYAGKWHMQGCVARVTVSYPQGNSRRFEHFTSGGLWGIESDSDEEYRVEIEMDQLGDLKRHLEQLGVDVSDFWLKYLGEPDG